MLKPVGCTLGEAARHLNIDCADFGSQAKDAMKPKDAASCSFIVFNLE
jgi:hypothetical protein